MLIFYNHNCSFHSELSDFIPESTTSIQYDDEGVVEETIQLFQTGLYNQLHTRTLLPRVYIMFYRVKRSSVLCRWSSVGYGLAPIPAGTGTGISCYPVSGPLCI